MQVGFFLKDKIVFRFSMQLSETKNALYEIRNCLEIKYEINTDLPSARAHHFKSVEQGLLY